MTASQAVGASSILAGRTEGFPARNVSRSDAGGNSGIPHRMKKVFIIHGFAGSPNGGWRPWLMGELEKRDVYACAFPMPTPENPICNEWVEEISRHVERNSEDEIYLVGHSLGVPAILRYLENPQTKSICGAVLVSGPSEKNNNRKIDSFLDKNFDFEKIKVNCKKFAVMAPDGLK